MRLSKKERETLPVKQRRVTLKTSDRIALTLSSYTDQELEAMTYATLERLTGRCHATIRHRHQKCGYRLRDACILNKIPKKRHKTLQDWAKELNVNYRTLISRRQRHPTRSIEELADAIKTGKRLRKQ